MREFHIQGEPVEIRESDLEAIRSAVIARLSLEEDELHNALSQELARSIAILGPQDSRLGRWGLTERGGALALVRFPDRDVVNYIFGATLGFRDSRWEVIDLFEERMQGR
ncbi:MAG: hypothetical protein AAFY29_21735 [Pseudomonadota bacterium]